MREWQKFLATSENLKQKRVYNLPYDVEAYIAKEITNEAKEITILALCTRAPIPRAIVERTKEEALLS